MASQRQKRNAGKKHTRIVPQNGQQQQQNRQPQQNVQQQQQNGEQQQQANRHQQRQTRHWQQHQNIQKQNHTIQQRQQHQNGHEQLHNELNEQLQDEQNTEALVENLTPPPKLTYREKRRLEQEKLRLKFPDRKRRGPTRGKKYASKMRNSNSEEKIKINFMDELRRVVGDKADEFICDCGNWVKEFCPLDSWNWAKMDSNAKQRLYNKIRGKYDLPEKGAGADVIEALSFQCSIFYKNWRYRLKEKHFRNKSVRDAIKSRPSTIDADQWTWLVCEYWNGEKRKQISKANTENKLKQTETPANGARSTARIFYDLINKPPTQPRLELEGSTDALEIQEDPLYITLFEKTKKHKGSGWEPNAEKHYEALKKLHESEMEKHGEDTLSVKAAYMEVFKNKSGYVRGLGRGARPPKKSRAEGDEVRVELSNEIQQLKEATAMRESVLVSQIDSLKASNDELRTSNEELIASNDELKATVSRINIDAIEREKKLREDMMKLFEQIRNNTS